MATRKVTRRCRRRRDLRIPGTGAGKGRDAVFENIMGLDPRDVVFEESESGAAGKADKAAPGMEMDPEELRTALSTLGLSHDVFCEAFKIDATRLGQWLEGAVPVPKPVGDALRIAAQKLEKEVRGLARIARQLQAPYPMIVFDDDAFYAKFLVFPYPLPFLLHVPASQELRRRLEALGVDVREVHLAGGELTDWCRSHKHPLNIRGFKKWYLDMCAREFG